MKNVRHILFFCCLFMSGKNVCFAQNDSLINVRFEKELASIQLLTDVQQNSEALKQLLIIEPFINQDTSVAREVKYRLMMARVLRLSNDFASAMLELEKLPDLNNYKSLKLKVDFRIAALYIDNGQYSMDEKFVAVAPIIDEGIKNAKLLGEKGDLAAFYNLKATIHRDDCGYNNRNCIENRKIATDYYLKAINLFAEVKDTLNYHNVLNGLFALQVESGVRHIDSLKQVVQNITEHSNYIPNIIRSRTLLSQYYITYEKDSIKYLAQKLLASEAKVAMTRKNSENTVGKIKLLYEFDTLKYNIELNQKIVAEQNLTIDQKNSSITLTIGFSILLTLFILILVFLLRKQKKISLQKNKLNLDLEKSVNSYQLLIREGNHRIKNNLQMILSMIALDMEVLDKKDKNLLRNISAKISTISALHRILDFKEHNEKVKLKDYFDEILAYYNNMSNNQLHFITDYAHINIQSERIIYFGLILNELIANTIEHRKFDDEIIIQVLKSDHQIIFNYRDNSNFGDYSKNNGIILIEGLIERFGGKKLVFNAKIGEYKFYFDE